MSKPEDFPYTTHLDIKFPNLSLVDVPGLVKACTDRWYNQTLCKVNNSVVRLGIMQGEYHWHKHDDDDEFFFVLEGHFIIDLEDRSVDLKQYEGFVVPKGVMHCTRAPERAVILMVETATITPTGDAKPVTQPDPTALRLVRLLPTLGSAMPEHSSDRRIDAFFYGLFMDESILRQSGVTPADPRRAYVADFALRIGQRSTLVYSKGARAFGMLMALTHADLELLYGAPGLEHYRPEAVVAHTLEGSPVPALCYNLLEVPRPEERNPEYAMRLRTTLNTLGFPREYVESIS